MMRIALLVAAVAGLAAAGCTPKIRIEWSRPPACALETTQKVALLVESDGERPSATEVLDVVIDAKNRGQVLNKWVAVKTVEEEFGTQLRRAGYSLVDRSQADVVVKVRPTAWSYALENKPNPKDVRSVQSGVGRLDLRVDVLDARKADAPPRFFESYWARAGAEDAGEPEAMLRASQRLAQIFLDDTRPTRVSALVELDDEDPICETGIALCKRNRFEAAYEAFADAVEDSPKSAPAHYDLGVMAEIKGDYEKAEQSVLAATKLVAKPMYYTALERVRKAKKDAEGMKSR